MTPRSIKRTLNRLNSRSSRHRTNSTLSSGLHRDDTPFVNLAWDKQADGQQVIDLRVERPERAFFEDARTLPN